MLAKCKSNLRRDEGILGWLSLNYMLGTLDSSEIHDHGKGHSTYGFLDMGGASAQVAFAPNATETEKRLNDLYTIRLRTAAGESKNWNVFVSSWLGFGANEARRRYLNTISPTKNELLDPCLPKGVVDSITSESAESANMVSHIRGTGDYETCLANVYPLLSKDLPCNDDPCLFAGVHAPLIDFDVNHFIGVSEYWHTSQDLLLHPEGGGDVYDLKIFADRVQEVCNAAVKSKEFSSEARKI